MLEVRDGGHRTEEFEVMPLLLQPTCRWLIVDAPAATAHLQVVDIVDAPAATAHLQVVDS